MNRREFGKTVAVGAAALMLPRRLLADGDEQPAVPVKQPNIIFILADDVGMPNIGCYGGNFKTPEIDALAKGGLRFEACYAAPLCGPSRCEALTGRYAFRTGMISNNSAGAMKKRRDAEIMLPKVMKPAGYVTGSIGKWAQLPFAPADWGFDEYLTFKGSGLYWREAKRDSYTVNGKTVDLPEGQYLPDILHDTAVDFITRHKDQPFYLYYPMSHIHEPIVRTPDSAEAKGRLGLAGNVAYMDKLVGKLIAELERLKLREKTMVVYSGDNGSAGGQVLVNGKPISGTKGTMREGGSRVPLIVNWPGTAPAGKVSQDMTDFSDFYPTFTEIIGAKLPDGVTIDGRSFAPQIKGQPGNPREWVYVELEGECYVRTAQWKLSGANELFDMKDAPFAEVPVAAEGEPAEAAAARKHLQDILDTKLAGYPKGKKLNLHH